MRSILGSCFVVSGSSLIAGSQGVPFYLDEIEASEPSAGVGSVEAPGGRGFLLFWGVLRSPAVRDKCAGFASMEWG